MAEGLTKKQLKELRKLEKLQSRNLEQKNNSIKWIAISVVSVLFLVLFVGTILVAKTNKNQTVTTDNLSFAVQGHERMVSTSEDNATISAEQAENIVTIVEYADIQCPACKTYHPMVNEILNSYPDRVKLIFKHYPLISIHPNAMPAAKAAEAAGRQGKFFEFVDLAYEKQAEWSALPNARGKFEEYAASLGLDVEKFKKDFDDPEIEKTINEQRDEGSKNGVTGTPTFFVNGERIQNPSGLDEFKKIIESKFTTTTPSAPTPTTDPNYLPLQQ